LKFLRGEKIGEEFRETRSKTFWRGGPSKKNAKKGLEKSVLNVSGETAQKATDSQKDIELLRNTRHVRNPAREKKIEGLKRTLRKQDDIVWRTRFRKRTKTP